MAIPNRKPIKMSFDAKVQEKSFRFLLKKKMEKAREAAYKQALVLAEQFLDKLVLMIKEQQFDLTPLNEKYKKHKEKTGKDRRILISSGAYINSLKVQVEKTNKGYIAKVVPPNEKHPNSMITYALLAKLLEYGSSTMPARPHWRPLQRIYLAKKREQAKEISNKMAKAFKE